ncbi:hypothetical protein [Natrinema pallidum]|uniref:Uncharacterized protein n=1 Tax=Natrinema pallidum TaxID=69527 RepID=A0A4V1IFJ9_9EURY|nr:hypothetical protein [Natrinema pallidum]QCW05254.1 hypothetical protein FGF80_18575 [Natrinema pallidum]
MTPEDYPYQRTGRAREVKSCAECGDPAELQYGGDYLCPDCYVSEPGAGGDIETRRETAAGSRKRLEELQAEGDQ